MAEIALEAAVSDEEFYAREFTERRRDDNLCTPKQATMLVKLGVSNPHNVRFEDVDRVAREARIANIASPPSQGQGVHKWMIRAARIMHYNGLLADEIT